VKRLLGEGGMGTVYLAEHALMGWRAAVKVLRRSLADDKVLVKRFINEAHAIKSIRHPNIIDIIDVGTLPDGLPYLLMELLEGESLGARLQKRGRLPVALAVHIARQTAAALGAAHDKGVVHRDLKPDNLFLIPDPEDPDHDRVKVLDFGIAKLRTGGSGGVHASPNTKSGVLLGTPAYMSPEQCRGIVGEVDHRTDIYALSVILHQMLAGKAPFVSPGTGDVLIMHISAEPPPVRLENPEVPPFVEEAILRGLAKRREHRFQSMAELAAALTGLVRDPVHLTASHPAPARPTVPISQVVDGPPETPLSWAMPATRFSRSSYRRLGAAGAVALTAITLGSLAAWQFLHAADEPPPSAAAPPPMVGKRGGLAPERRPAENTPAPQTPQQAPQDVREEPAPSPATAKVVRKRTGPRPSTRSAKVETPPPEPVAPPAETRPNQPATPSPPPPQQQPPRRRTEPWL
jgi:serine/threonine protein kinase